MSDSLDSRADDILCRALERPPEIRAGFLDRECGKDEELRREVESLLEASETVADGFLDRPLLPVGDEPEPEVRAGRRLGAYRILDQIARGGMGTVYRAVRADDTYRQQVAIKVLKRGLDTDEIVRRFHHERQILARLVHPHISRLLDAGTTDDGLPYFVMEHVEGEPIDRWCDRRRLPLRARLELFRKVCAAVHFAHQHLVVHRDLKPANILITEDGEPRLLDFGIAKLLGPGQEGLTMPELRPMTPEHASPEQIRGEPITTATDVYALGVLLYQLLTGRRPHGDLRDAPLRAFHRICHEEPEAPSRALPRAARRRARRLAGDLDSIVLKALERDPRRRYGSVEQLSEDLQRHLRGRTVLARPPSLPYRVGKFVRRHRVGVALTAAVMLLVLGFGVTMKVLRDRAERQRQRAEAVTAFLVDVFQRPNPELAKGEEVTARQLLDEGAKRIEAELAGAPAARADLMGAMGWAYLGLGHYERAESLLARSLSLRRVSAETQPEELARGLLDLAAVRWKLQRYDEAEELTREARTILSRGGADSIDLARTLNNQAVLLRRQGNLRAAEQLYRESLAMKVRLLGEESADVATGKSNLALALKDQGRYDDAERLYRESLDLRLRLHGEMSTEVATTRNGLALVLQEKGDLAAAEELLRQSLDLRRRLRGPRHPRVASALNNLAFLLQLRGRLDEAEPLYRQALSILSERYGDDHPRVAGVLRNFAALAFDRGAYADAEATVRRALAIFRRSLPADAWRMADAESVLGACLAARGRGAEAELLLRRGHAALEATLGPSNRRTREARERLERFQRTPRSAP